jgi:hypothetical protein
VQVATPRRADTEWGTACRRDRKQTDGTITRTLGPCRAECSISGIGLASEHPITRSRFDAVDHPRGAGAGHVAVVSRKVARGVRPTSPWALTGERLRSCLDRLGDGMATLGVKAELHSYLRGARETLVWKLDGLSEYDIRRPLTPTGTNLLGLVKHTTFTHVGYFGDVFGRNTDASLARLSGDAGRAAEFWAAPDESSQDIVTSYRDAWKLSDATITELPLDAVGQVWWWGDTTVTQSVDDVDIEAHNTETAFIDPEHEPYEAERREARLVKAYEQHLKRLGHRPYRHRIRPAGEAKPLFTDLYDPVDHTLVEAKGTTTREAIRMAIGQLCDYRRFVSEARHLAVLVPTAPRPDLEELVKSCNVSVIYPDENSGEFTSAFAGDVQQ